MTSHAALVARGWGKCCIVGCNELIINYKKREAQINGHLIKHGDWITLNGSKGLIFKEKLYIINSISHFTTSIDVITTFYIIVFKLSF